MKSLAAKKRILFIASEIKPIRTKADYKDAMERSGSQKKQLYQLQKD